MGVVGWEELPDETAAWTILRSALGGTCLPGVWLMSEVTLVIWKPLLFLLPLILKHRDKCDECQ